MAIDMELENVIHIAEGKEKKIINNTIVQCASDLVSCSKLLSLGEGLENYLFSMLGYLVAYIVQNSVNGTEQHLMIYEELDKFIRHIIENNHWGID